MYRIKGPGPPDTNSSSRSMKLSNVLTFSLDCNSTVKSCGRRRARRELAVSAETLLFAFA